MGLLRIFCSADDEKLLKGHLSLEPDPIEELKSGDRLTIEFVLMQRNTSNFYEEPWVRALSASYSLRIGLFLSAAPYTELAYQNNFPAQDEFTRAGTLALDTAAITSALAAVQEVATTFEVEITDGLGNDRTVYREAVTLRKALIASAGASVPPGEVAMTFSQWKALSMPRDGANADTPMKFFTMQSSPSGFPMMVTIKDDGTWDVVPQ